MDEKQYQDNQPGYDTDTFGTVNEKREQSYGQSYAQGSDSRNSYNQGSYGQNAHQTDTAGGGFYHSGQPVGNGFGIASMVLGILALVFFCGCINIPLAIISIIFAIIHINRKTGSIGFAIAGIVTSTISVILTVIMIVAFMYYGVGTTSWMYSETMPFEYFMDDDDYYDDFGGGEDSDDLPFGGHHHGQDL
ncbi:MAG: DUF4190 domain-containing protein [bacterium]|nr:DUF4190 domain-containing protein [bacterium]MDY4100570.1 DUF4190 domain-containing protein [Lachnospiraceae bacterium]